MMDDTATANAETVAWLNEVRQAVTPANSLNSYTPDHSHEAAPTPGVPDTFELAMQAARSGRAQEGIELLMRELAQERSGRARFSRKIQLTQLCIATNHEAIAFPILQELAAEIERRKLEDWEAPDLLAQPLALLYRCLATKDGDPADRQKLYAWLCRLDPLAALSVAR